ncbi:MAG: HEAT repeat domain-containing protein, partial [Planctomycetes bacterium]|nr:HEAT repeat domain-containing protein [Planctomycetota bacterium]
INRNVDENDDNNIKVPDNDETTEPTEKPDDDSTPPTRLTPKMQKILENLDSSIASERLNAIMDISWENYRGATPKLLEIVKNDSDKWVRVFAIKVLVGFREKKLIPVLKNIVFEEQASIVTEEAKQALSELEKFAR